MDYIINPNYISITPYAIATFVVGIIALYLMGEFLQWWSLHEWRVGIKAAIRKHNLEKNKCSNQR